MYNIFMGTMGHQLTGTVDFKDEQNNITGTYTFGNVKKKHQDYFKGELTQNGRFAGEVYGTYMGYMEMSQ